MRLHILKIVKILCTILLVGFLINFYNSLKSKINYDQNLSDVVYDQVQNEESLNFSIRPNKMLPKFNDQSQLDYISKHLDIRYNVVANFREQFVVNLVMKNNGDKHIEKCCWTIYFYHTKFINTIAVNSRLILIANDKLNLEQHFNVQHVNGYTFSIFPSDRYDKFDPGSTKIFQIFGNGWMVSKSEVIPNWYVANDRVSLTPKLIASTTGEDMSFVGSFIHENQTLRSTIWDRAKPFTAKSRYKMNEIRDAGSPLKPIIPTPLNIEVTIDSMLIMNNDNAWTIYYIQNLFQEADFLKSHLSFMSLKKGEVGEISEYSIQLKIDADLVHYIPSDSGRLYLPHAYSLIVDARKKTIVVIGLSKAGVFYGIISLFSLASISSPSQHLTEVKVPSIILYDAPRYEHRGVMVDVSRNFHTKSELFKLMDVLALYKLNVLHLHLCDDEGWRIEIPGLPELTNIGGHRSHDLGEQESLLAMLGSGPNNKTSGSGYYTVQDYKEILKYANTRHIQVIPEIDMPGHSHAAIKSMQARYSYFKRERNSKEAKKYLVSDLNDRSSYMSGQFFKDCALNPCIESTYRFVEHVIEEIVKMHQTYQPLQRYHFGGDEVPQNAYTGSTACLRFLQTNKNRLNFVDLKAHFVRRVTTMLISKNLSIIGWEDAFTSEKGGQMHPNELKTGEFILQYYLNNWESGAARRPYDYANAGFKVILSPFTALYFDNPQEPDPNDYGLHWGTRYANTKRAFNFAPENIYNSIDFDYSGQRLKRDVLCFQPDLCPQLQRPENILGMEGVMWSELIRTESRMDSMLWPRMLAVAERSWHRADWETAPDQATLVRDRSSDWMHFANTVGYKELKRLEALNVEYYLPRVGARLKQGKLYLNSMFPGQNFTISLDQGNTWQDYDPQKKYHKLTFLVATRTFDGKRKSVPIYLKLP